ncbi:MAG: histidine phosphotransferase family protein [Acetobacteraceae bacterium]|nr:histidine phosphotransferase family protein [Acetobacteraceae bacterium]
MLEEPLADLTDALRLAESLCARICHDLSGALGTVGGMLEMMQASGAAEDEPLTLASESAAALQQRLELLRAAWGATPRPLSLAALRALAAGLPRARKLAIDLDGVRADSGFPPEAGRAALAFLLLAADSLPLGGRIALAGVPDDLIVLIEGPSAAWPSGFAACLRDETAIQAAFADPRGLALPLAFLFARSANMQVSLLLAAVGTAPPPVRLFAD